MREAREMMGMAGEEIPPARVTPPARTGVIPVVVTMEALYLIHSHAASGSPHRTGIGWPLSPPSAATAAALAAVSLAALVGLWWHAVRRMSPDRTAVFVAAALFGVTLALAPAMASASLMDDMGHGRVLARYGANPYLTTASTFPPDAILGAMGRSGSTPLAGPAWISLASLLALAGAGRLTATLLAFKLLLLASHLINGALIAWLAARWKSRPESLSPSVAAAFYLWNPLVILQALGEGQHHVVALTFLLLSLWLVQRGDESLGWGCAAMACLVDYVMLPVAGLLLIQRWRRGPRPAVLAGAGLAALVCVVAFAPYLRGFPPSQLLPPYWLPTLPAGARAAYERVLSLVVPQAWFFNAARTLWGALALGLLIWWVRAAARSGEPADAAGRGAVFVLAALLSGAAAFEMSAIGWAIALSAVAGSEAVRRGAALLSAGALAVYLLGLYRLLSGAAPQDLLAALLVVSLVAVGPPILYLVLRFRGRRSAGPREVEESA